MLKPIAIFTLLGFRTEKVRSFIVKVYPRPQLYQSNLFILMKTCVCRLLSADARRRWTRSEPCWEEKLLPACGQPVLLCLADDAAFPPLTTQPALPVLAGTPGRVTPAPLRLWTISARSASANPPTPCRGLAPGSILQSPMTMKTNSAHRQTTPLKAVIQALKGEFSKLSSVLDKYNECC